MISLVMVSDIRLYREALGELLDDNNQIHVIGTAIDTESALQLIQQCTPEIVLLDMTMLESCNLIQQINPVSPNTKIVALAMAEDEDSILTCAKAGITGYVSRDASLEQLICTVQGVANGELYCPRKITASLFHKLKSLSDSVEVEAKTATEQPVESKISLLTQRERQIIQLITEGLSNKQIARQLMIEVSTVKNHVHNILSKMDVHSRMQLINIIQQQYSYE